jgi:hypothetical protein
MPNQQSKPRDVPADEIGVWVPFDMAYTSFVAAYPAFGLQTGTWSAQNFRRTYGDRLVEAGAAMRLQSGKWLAHEIKFAPAVVQALKRRVAS